MIISVKTQFLLKFKE